MKAFADLLADNPLVLLCLLLAVGSAVGALSFKRFSLGPAAVLEPHFRAARQSGAIECTELDEGMLLLGLQAKLPLH